MNSLSRLALIMLTLSVSALASSGAIGQQKSLKEQIAGTWKYVSVDTIRPDGTWVPLFGPDPQGVATFDSEGHYILLTSRAGLPRFAINNRDEGG